MGKSKDLATGETRFVNTSGDSMTGALSVSGGANSAHLTLSGSSNRGLKISTSNPDGQNDGTVILNAQDTEASGVYAKMSFQTAGTERMKIDNVGRVTTPYQPSFAARSLTSSATQQDCVFPTIRHNVGNHYSNSTGRFTCPVAGTYLFGWTNIGGNANDVYRYYIRVNGSPNISGTSNDTHLRIDTGATGSEYGTNGMFTWPVQLSANDYVNIYYYADSGTGTYSSGDYPQFWGYLVG